VSGGAGGLAVWGGGVVEHGGLAVRHARLAQRGLALAEAVEGQESIPQDLKHPGAHVGSRLEAVREPERARIRFLDEILGLRAVAGQVDGEIVECVDMLESLLPELVVGHDNLDAPTRTSGPGGWRGAPRARRRGCRAARGWSGRARDAPARERGRRGGGGRRRARASGDGGYVGDRVR